MEVQISIPKFQPIMVHNETWNSWTKFTTLKRVQTFGELQPDGSVRYRHTLKSGHIKTAVVKSGYYEIL